MDGQDKGRMERNTEEDGDMEPEESESGGLWAILHPIFLGSVVLGVCLMACAYVLSAGLASFRSSDITVKGVAEDHYNADLAQWEIGYQAGYDAYDSALRDAPNQAAEVETFLKKMGFDSKEIDKKPLSISDRYEDYKTADGLVKSRHNGYIAKQSYVITTRRIDRIAVALPMFMDLRAKNDSLYHNDVEYSLSDLESIKLSMIGSATTNARARAEKFLGATGGKVGKMKSASQGQFDIYAENSTSGDDDSWGGSYDKTTVGKTVRLVVTAKFETL